MKATWARWRDLARLGVALVAAACIVAATIQVFGSEELEILSEIQYIPYPAFLIPSLAAFAVSFGLGYAWRFVAGLALILVLVVHMGLELNGGESGSGRLRMMTFNVKDYVTLNDPQGALLIAAEIARHDADVIVLQDAGGLMRLEERAPGALRALFGTRQLFSRGQYLVASRFALAGCEGRPPGGGDGHYEHVRCVMTAHGVEVDLMTAHFTSPRGAYGAVREGKADGFEAWRANLRERVSQADAVALDLRGRKRPVIFAGDLNAPERSLVIQRLIEAGLRDAFSTAGTGYGYTYGHALRHLGFSFLRIDHILVSEEIAVAGCFVGGAEASPHRPVIADLYFRRR
jgi:endonuclease/exonuclease/phosphatase family metal-dependent hydrolase